ncbi:MAG: AAA family ATPase [Bauldia sp.]|nr:AAA family ATPase [Bauldia sp.]
MAEGEDGERPGMEASRSELRIVTALFCDVVGSTSLAEQLGAEDWADVVQGAFGQISAAAVRYGGSVSNLLGDAVMAVFGLPAAHEDDPQRAILAALAMMSAMRTYDAELRSRFGIDLRIRIGINTGPVVATFGKAGAEPNALGDAMNVAARMEQTAEPGTIQISDDTWRLVAPLFEAEPIGPVELKGKAEPVNAWRIIGRKAAPGRLRGVHGVSAPLVGRDHEYGQLQAAMASVLAGRGGVVLLIGEAGLGKSRMLADLKAEWDAVVADPRQWSVMTGVPYDASRPYGLFQSFARSMFGVDADDPAPLIHQKIVDGIRDMGGNDDQVALCSVAFERVIAARSLHDAPDFEAEVIRRDIYDNMYPGFRKTAEEGPTVVVVDDFHWADAASVDLLLHLLPLIDEVPLLVIVSMRPERQSPGWRVKQRAETDFPHRLTAIDLKPLGEGDTDALVSALLTIADLPPELRRMILRKADGNPYFVEEIVRALIDDNIVVQTPDGLRWEARTNVAEISIPDTLQALLMARIDRLDQETRSTLQVASVIGRSFYYKILRRISESAIVLDSQLGTLERVELLREAGRSPELEYMFKHELARDAAYGSLLNKKRRNVHRSVAEAMETLFADRIEEHAHRLAQHFELAGESARAQRYYAMAGETAASLNARREGAAFFAHAAQCARAAGAPDTEVETLAARSSALETSAVP